MNIGKFSGAISVTSILGKISKALNVANQLIPIYNQAKPLFSNSKKILGVISDISKSSNITNGKAKKEEHKKTDIHNNLPVFFS